MEAQTGLTMTTKGGGLGLRADRGTRNREIGGSGKSYEIGDFPGIFRYSEGPGAGYPRNRR